MSTILSRLMATAIATSFAVASVIPAVAVPAYSLKAPSAEAAFQQVQYDGYWQRRMNRDDRRYRIIRRGNVVYLNGHRGYRDYRPGYRRYNDFWFPAGAFIAGAIIGGALNQPRYAQPPYVQRTRNDAHVQWCYDRYRSYRASDNTFQPYNGPRRQCYSPYS